MGKNILIIHNPAAGQKTADKVSAVARAIGMRGGRVVSRATTHPGHAEEILRAERNGSHDVIALAGGDGTLMEGVNGLEPGDQQKIAIIPAGTANVLALELGLPSDPGDLAEVILAGRTRPVETASLNGRRFVFTAGAGFDAQVVANVDSRLKRKAGKLAFVASAARTLAQYRFEPLEMDVDGQELSATGVIVMNGRHYGGPFVAAPDNDLGNGTLCVLALMRRGRLAALSYQAALGLGRLHQHPDVRYFSGVRAVNISSPAGAPVQADGDFAGHVPVSIIAGAGTVHVVC